MIQVVGLYALMAFTFTLGKAIVSFVQPITFIGMRMFLSGVLLLGYQYFFNRSQWRFSRADIMWYVQIMLFHVYFSYIGEFLAYAHGVHSSKAALFFSLSPFFTALLGYYLSLETMNLRKWVGLAIGIVGFFPILLEQPMSAENTFTWWYLSFGELSLLIAVLSSVYAWLLMKRFVHGDDYSPVMINGIAMAGGGFLALLTSLIVEKAPLFTFVVPVNDHLGAWLMEWFSAHATAILLFCIYSGLLILITNVIFYNAYGYLLRRYSATFLSLVGVTTPLFAAVYDWLLLGDRVGWGFVTSMIVMSLGLMLFYREEQK